LIEAAWRQWMGDPVVGDPVGGVGPEEVGLIALLL
jgi:hypothetical protein